MADNFRGFDTHCHRCIEEPGAVYMQSHATSVGHVRHSVDIANWQNHTTTEVVRVLKTKDTHRGGIEMKFDFGEGNSSIGISGQGMIGNAQGPCNRAVFVNMHV